ncbi:hypothetical protein BMF94_4797 [Rhodotorula taiwanensis]|uniref:C3H1-type domain-containing protein n=1 Tax=Rhodotorula taiwanensis TaxID=741276 RepID=A0A2S5B5U9_9BASI|nr:hypothetical protein BMF94_4797 [Rhodotorula taiwanensis]
MPVDSTDSYPHTRALLHYLFTVYGRGKGVGTSPPAPLPPNSSMALLEISVRKLALAQHRAASAASSSAPSDTSATTDDEDEGDKKSVSARSAADDLPDEDKTKLVIDKLEDPSVDEDDMPDAIKETLNDLLVIPPGEIVDLDPLILALLHRHREDLHPSGNPVPPLPNHGSVTPGSRPSLSRSSSLRGSGMLAPGTPRGAGSRSPSRSPWSSPKPLARTLNANSSAFKFSVAASEFRPGVAGSGRASPASPGTPGRTRSPMPISAHQAQQNWALNHSPLSTPRHSVAGSVADTASAASSPGYFPRELDPAAGASAQSKSARMPWADLASSNGDAEEETNGVHARLDDAGLPAETMTAFGGGGSTASPLYSPAIPIDQTAYGHPQTMVPLMTEDGQQWAEYPAGAAPEAGYYYPPQGYPAPPPGFAPPVEYGVYQGGPMFDPAMYGGAEAFVPGGGPAGGDAFEMRGPGPAFITLPGPAPGEMPSIDFANQLSGSSGLGSIGAYAMTPFDHLHSIFGDSISAEVLEEALNRSGFDVDQAIEYVIDTQIGNVQPPPPMMADIPPGMMPAPQSRGFGASGSRPLIISHDSFDGFSGGNGGRGQWGARSGTPTGADSRGVGGRVCRFYLAGNCLRSDCKFSHDVSKAVCKFWLRGHCLKGDGRCDFLHSIPPVLRADYEARTRMRQEAMYNAPPESIPDEGPELDFPTLGDAPRSRRPMGGRGTVQLDPNRTRFAGAVKYGQKVSTPLPSRNEPTVASAKEAAPAAPRRSARLNLRPPALLPTLPTGQSLAALYIRYRQNFLELGANRNKCLAKAAECFKRGDGAGARKWSREAQDWSRQVAIEGRDSALKIVEERKRILKEAIDANEGRGGSVDDVPDRRARGQERGGGICLGVVSKAVVSDSRPLTEEERTEVALDLHALHTDEAIGFMGDFLLKLESQKFQGLAFIVIGQQKHSGSSAPDKGEAAGRLRLERATTEFLSDQGWAWRNFDGILAVDCLR